MKKLGNDIIRLSHWGTKTLKSYPDGVYQLDELGTLVKYNKEKGLMHVIHSPLADASIEDLDDLEFPDPHDQTRYELLDETIERYGDTYAIESGTTNTWFQFSTYLRGYQKFFIDLIENPEWVKKLLEKVLEWSVERAKEVSKRDIDFYYISDDYGTQTDLMISPEMWRDLVKPGLKKIVSIPRSRGIPVRLHSDGYVWKLIPDFIEIGVSILNPINPMDPAQVKQKYGDKLVLHGTLDVQHTMPHGTPEDVKNEVIERMRTCGRGGGFIIAPGHSLTPDVPLENILAFVDAIHKYGKYPIKEVR